MKKFDEDMYRNNVADLSVEQLISAIQRELILMEFTEEMQKRTFTNMLCRFAEARWKKARERGDRPTMDRCPYCGHKKNSSSCQKSHP